MQRMLDSEDGKGALRVSAPDGEGHCFIIMPGSDGTLVPPSSDETGPFAREGA